MPKVSVIIPCYNYARYLPDALGSVLAQSYRDIEVIIVDDGSTDDTAAVADRIVSEQEECRVRLISQKNQGLPAARNSGLRVSSGEYYLQLDADDMITTDCIEKLVRVLDADPGLDFVYSWTRRFGNESRLLRNGPFTWRTMVFREGPTSTSLIRKSVWVKAGGYDPDMRKGEDWDFFLTLFEMGCRAEVVEEPLLLIRSHGVSMTDGNRKEGMSVSRAIKLRHPALFEPFLCRISVRLARAVIRLKLWIRDPITRYFYINFPRLHGFFRDIKYSGLK